MSTTEVHVHRFGSAGAPPLVLVHGLTDDGTTWPDAVAEWGAGWDIHAVDQRGHGLSARFTPDDVTFSHRLWVKDLRTVVARTGQPSVVMGHSLGGLVALRLGIESPELVKALVLEDPARPGDADGPDLEFVAEQQKFLSAFPAQEQAEVERILRETSWSEAETRAWAASKARVDPLMIERGLFLGDAEWESLFQALTVPTLLVLPEDGGMGPDESRYRNPLVEQVKITGAGHCVRRDQPAAFYAAVDSFFSRQQDPHQ